MDLTVSDGSLWDRERRIAALDRNYTLRTEAEDVVRYTVFAIRHSMCVLTILGRYGAKIRPDFRLMIGHSVQAFGLLTTDRAVAEEPALGHLRNL